MIRPLTCICLLLAGGSGLYLYQSKHRAQMLDREIERTLKAADVARDRIGVLRGEWALLNEPERLAALSQSHLGLKSLAPSQFVSASELGARLPPPAAPGTVYAPGYTPDEEETTVVDALPQPPAPVAPPMMAHTGIAVVKAPSVPPAAPARPPVQVVSTLPPPVSPSLPRPIMAHPVLAPVVNVSATSIVASPAPKPVPPRPTPSASVNAGTANAGPAAVSARPSTSMPPASSIGGSSIGDSVARMARSHGGIQAAGVAAPASPPAYSPPAPNQAVAQSVASSLGGIRPSLPPPVPFGSTMAASLASAR